MEVREGLARLLVPEGHAIKGPGKVGPGPFYNATMAFPRHVSILALEALGSRVRRALDGLSSTGVLGIRLALELSESLELTLNDRRRDARRLMERNLSLNGQEGARVLSEDLNLLLCRERYDYVDVDPFGSPVPFVDNGLRSIRPRGFLAVTATDTAALAGTYPRTCMRRYGAMPIRAPFRHEAGLRILVGAIVRSAARADLAARPLLAFWREHYYKAFLEVSPGARRADEALSLMGYVVHDPTGPRAISSEGDVGPLWIGPLHQRDVLKRIRSRKYVPAAVDQYLEVWREEADAPPLFYTTDEVARAVRVQAPALRDVLRRLKEAGLESSRTTFHPKGFKTNATWQDLVRLFQPS